MKNLFILIVFLVSISTNAQNIRNFKASKLFFVNNEFGAVIVGDHSIVITENGGQEWEKINIATNEKISKVLFTSTQNGWLIADSTIFSSNDGGHNWTANNTFKVHKQYALSFINSNIGFVGGQKDEDTNFGPIIYYTQNGGQNWVSAKIDTNTYSPILDFSFVNDSVGIAVASNAVFKTTDSGLSWNELPINFYLGAEMPNAGTMLDDSTIILTVSFPNVVLEGSLLSSFDGGLTWKRFGNGQSFMWGIRDAFILNQDSIWLTTGEKTYFTDNSGSTWDTLEVKLEEFSFTSDKQAFGLFGKYIYSTTDGWKTYSVVDSTVTNVETNESILSSFKIYQNYPNPFNSTTIIEYQLSKPSYVELSIYNVLGQKLKILVSQKQSEGHYSVAWNASEFPSGVYYYRLNTDRGFAQTKKMIVLK